MKVRKIIQRTVRHDSEGVQIAGDVNAAISANVNEPGPSRTHASSKQRVVQRSGRKRKPGQGGDEGEGGLIDANVAAPINAAVAVNVLSSDSVAAANAEQDVEIDQDA